MPVWVTLENHGPGLLTTILVESSPAGEGTNHTASLELSTASRKRLVFPIYVDGFATRVSVTAQHQGETLATSTANLTCLTANDQLYAVISEQPSSFNPLLDVPIQFGRPFLASIQLHEMPELPMLLSALDGVFVFDVDTSSMSALQRLALEQWVTNGGLLLVAGGPSAQRTLSGLTEVLAVQIEGNLSLNGLPALEDFAGTPVPIEGQITVNRISTTQFSSSLVQQNDVPLLVERRLGLGSALFMPMDPLSSSMRNWPGISEMYARILERQSITPAWARGFVDWNTAAEAAASLPGRALPSLILICGLLFLYVLAIGPANFWLLRRMGHLELAWFTTPGLVIVFSLLTYMIGNSIRGNRPVLHELAIVRTGAGAPVAEVDGLIGIFSPRRSRFTLMSSGSMIPYPFSGSADRFSDNLAIHQTEAGFEVPDIRVDVAETRGLAISGVIEAPAVSHQLSLTSEAGFAKLIGEVNNRSGLLLEDTVIVRGDQVLPVGDLQPNSSRQIEIAFDRSLPVSAVGTGLGPRPLDLDLVEGIAGSRFSIRNPDDQSSRRFAFLNALLGTFEGQANYHPGIFMMAWSDSSPLEVRLSDTGYESTGTTLYVFELDASIDLNDDFTQLPPAFFEWQLGEESLSRNFGPYRTSLEAGASAIIEYRLHYSLLDHEIDALTLNLSAYQQTGAAPVEIALWNWLSEAWDPLESPAWGLNPLSSEEAYIGSDGIIRLRLTNPDARQNVPVERVDFTMIVSS